MTPQREEAERYLRLVRRDEAAFHWNATELRRLTPYAVEFRYDDEAA